MGYYLWDPLVFKTLSVPCKLLNFTWALMFWLWLQPVLCQLPIFIGIDPLIITIFVPGLGFQSSNIEVSFVFNESGWEVVVGHFVDIGGIVDHQCLNLKKNWQ